MASAEDSSDEEQPAAHTSGSDSEGSQGNETQHDIMEGTDTAAALQALSEAVADPAAFIRPSADIASAARHATKALYEYAMSAGREDDSSASAAASSLHVDDFDAEQIWGQLEMAAGPLLKRVKRLIARAGEAPALLRPEAEAALNDLREDVSGASSSGEETEDSDDGRSHAPRVRFANGVAGEGFGGSEDEAEAGGGGGEGEQPEVWMSRAKRKADQLPTEDDFMRLDDMEAFVQEAERAAMQEDGEEGVSSDEEEDEDEEGFEDGDVESGSDAELAAVLDNANALVGRPAQKKRRTTGLAEEASSSDEEGGDEMYDDFFDRRDKSGGAGEEAGFEEEEEEEESEEEEAQRQPGEEWDGDALFDTGEGREGEVAVALKAGAGQLLDSDEDGGDELAAKLSKHERRTKQMQERIAAMEAAAMGGKDWFMRGEAQAEHRPLNSALELDLDFERTTKPPPAPTQESTASLEDLIKARIAEKQFDNVVRVAPPPPDARKTVLELDDKKSRQGLGELYEEEYVKAAMGRDVVEERDAATTTEARTLLKALFARMDALSHYHFAPKPVVEDMAVRAEVPALTMEEVAPKVVSEASMRYAGEVFHGEKGGVAAADGEQSREDRKRARASKKRAGKKHRAQKESEKRERIVAKGGTAALAGRKSEEAVAVMERSAKKDKKKSGGRSEYTKSSKVFAKLHDEQAAAAAGQKPVRAAKVVGDGRPAALLKL